MSSQKKFELITVNYNLKVKKLFIVWPYNTCKNGWAHFKKYYSTHATFLILTPEQMNALS